MIVAKTPLRIPFAGGLTDLRDYAAKYGGVTVSTTIDKHIFVMIKENLGGYFRLKYTDVQEKVNEVAHIKHDLIREAVQLTGLHEEPLDIVIMSDLAGESGLGTSGAVTVALLHAMHTYKSEAVTKGQLLQEASQIEVEILGGASGYHDPSICALGGLKRIEYDGPSITAKDITLSPEMNTRFQNSLLFFYGGRHNRSKPSLALLSSRMADATETLHAIKALGYTIEAAFEAGDLSDIARCIGEMQALKQTLPGMFVDDYVEDVVKRVRSTGAYAQLPGGKISAFVIVCCPEGQQNAVRAVMTDHNEVKLRLEPEGTQAITI